MFPTLSTSRLDLVQVTSNDQSFIFEGLSHPDVIPFYGVRFQSYEETAAQMQWYRQMEEEGTGLTWKMIEKETGLSCGVISVYYFKPEHAKAEIGFWLLPQFWNRGYALEALNVILHYWKEQRNLHRMEGFVEEGNTASAKLLEKAGFSLEGKMVDCEKKEGRFISLLIYAKILD